MAVAKRSSPRHSIAPELYERLTSAIAWSKSRGWEVVKLELADAEALHAQLFPRRSLTPANALSPSPRNTTHD